MPVILHHTYKNLFQIKKKTIIDFLYLTLPYFQWTLVGAVPCYLSQFTYQYTHKDRKLDSSTALLFILGRLAPGQIRISVHNNLTPNPHPYNRLHSPSVNLASVATDIQKQHRFTIPSANMAPHKRPRCETEDPEDVGESTNGSVEAKKPKTANDEVGSSKRQRPPRTLPEEQELNKLDQKEYLKIIKKFDSENTFIELIARREFWVKFCRQSLTLFILSSHWLS